MGWVSSFNTFQIPHHLVQKSCKIKPMPEPQIMAPKRRVGKGE